FTTHGTHLNTLPGKVTLCDLFEEDESSDEGEDNETITFRNPLEQPREVSVKTLRHEEADYIAKQIHQIQSTGELMTDNGCIRPIEFSDIMILMRNRTHIDIYEDALKQHGIPFIGSKKGGLLENLEIRDLNCLLNTLITPYDNLALAQVLKSPIFSASDDNLILLARENNETHWYKRLLLLAEHDAELSKPLQRAARLLPRWQQLAEHLPVHDALDKIFSEGNIINRYIAANKQQNKQKIAANCQRFLELSLETDSGRYPSITRFLQRLSHLQNYSANPPEEPLSQSNESRVRLMTIHGSKGLESPVVFLADCNSTASNKNAYASLVRWPAEKSQPTNFQLQLSKDHTDQITQRLQQEKLDEQQREELNLLYVALTRAREQLYISGVASNRSQNHSWYQIIADGLDDITERETSFDETNCKVYRHLAYDHCAAEQTNKNVLTEDNSLHIDERLLKPIEIQPKSNFLIAPSLHTTSLHATGLHTDFNDSVLIDTSDKDDDKTGNNISPNNIYQREVAIWRGTIIHRIIEQLCIAETYPATENAVDAIRQQIKTDVLFSRPAYIDYLEACVKEAVSTYNHADLKFIFKPASETQRFNEMPLMYKQQQQAVYGFVDRVIKSENDIMIVDYKSHQLDDGENTRDSALQFSTQMDYYRSGIKKLWPEHAVKAGILFTHHNEIVWLD
ncbi:MAG: PD-(D/E)XK nuclease family protein, partial [Proteobacteria bacterium]|nr:PD-(D/E)XK nuclease family protein [Pseudomonadota bacterium]